MKIIEIIISYNPNPGTLLKNIESIKNQVDKICIVDNGSKNINLLNFSLSNIEFIKLEENTGIATATNIGFDYAVRKNFDFILLSDQDTVYSDTYIKNFIALTEKINIFETAALAPMIFDTVSQTFKPSYVLNKNRIKKIFINKELFQIFQSIASGLLINANLIKKIGGMNGSLFIDYVDFEWCWRANAKGYKIYSSNKLIIQHSLGDKNIKIVNRDISLRNPIRYYYIIRNVTYLGLYTQYLPTKAKKELFLSALKYILGYTILSKFNTNVFFQCIRGFCDGINKNLGK